ncbi:MAG: mannose-1-phosphate guanylyltransferase [Bacteroidales bacterium]|nr:mannose-1-phosphate guanylyltransferase [Bacteroidales bacterium]
MNHNFCVIMAGGAGTRFWPMSTSAYPKQFIDFFGTGKSLLQMTLDRFRPLIPIEHFFIVTSERYYQVVKTQLPELKDEQILLEPFRRNTAPCIAYANGRIRQIDPDANIVVTPSDHLIYNEQSFVEHISSALACTENNAWLLTLGIQPTRPETGYGYIQYDEKNSYLPDPRISKVKLFTEKPQLELAKHFLESGDFLWNAGIFVWKAAVIRQAFERYLPEIHNLFLSIEEDLGTEREKASIERIYTECTSISIDYGVMEKAENVNVLASDFGWTDLGTWSSLHEQIRLHEQTKLDEEGNALLTQANNTFLYKSSNNIIAVPKEKVAVVEGLDGYIVAVTDEVVLICRKEEEQNIRQFVTDVQIVKGDIFV